MSKHDRYSFFSHTSCEFFPCHPTDRPQDFNCLFCYCPLYSLGLHCGGDFELTGGSLKDCSGCLFPHLPENYDAVLDRLASADGNPGWHCMPRT